MMRTLGNTVAKSCRKGMLKNRDFSSAADVTSSTARIRTIVDRATILGFGGAGYLFCGVTVSDVAEQVKQAEENVIALRKSVEQDEKAFFNN